MSIFLLAIIFIIIACIYSSAGFGGGSSYVAILLLLNLPMEEVRWIALICNLVVVATSCWYFYKVKLLDLSQFWPLVVLSIPFAFWGGMIELDLGIYRIIAGFALLLAAGSMMMNINQVQEKRISIPTLSVLGGGIGFVSGFIGIGGGIFLSPILYLMRWQTAKTISAASSFFILVNSLSGLIGQATNHPKVNLNLCIVLGLSVFLGGQLGNRLNIHILSPEKIKLISAILIAVIGFKILITQLCAI